MAKKGHKPEEAVAKLRQVDVLVSQGPACPGEDAAGTVGDCRKFRVWGRTMPLKEPSYATTQTAFDPG